MNDDGVSDTRGVALLALTRTVFAVVTAFAANRIHRSGATGTTGSCERIHSTLAAAFTHKWWLFALRPTEVNGVFHS
jgi:hypothetical protein